MSDDWEFPPYEEPVPDEELWGDWDESSAPPPDEEAATRPGDVVSLETEIVETLRAVLAAQHGRTPGELASIVRDVASSTSVLERLDDTTRSTYEGVLEVLLDAGVSCEGGTVNLFDLPLAKLYSDDVVDEIAAVAALAGTTPEGSPVARLQALRERVQRTLARRRAKDFVGAIDSRATVSELLERYAKLESPTTKGSAERSTETLTARQLMEANRAAKAGRPTMRFSSGFRTVDIALTGAGEPLGWIAPGEGNVVAGPTGTGKSSHSYATIPAMAQDLVNWGFPDAKVVFFHTEEESEVKIQACRLDVGQSMHHLADNVVVVAVGTSRTKMATTLYDLVIDARAKSLETGRPIDQFLPHVVVLDYIQSISERGETEYVATGTTAEFLLRGVQAWNHEEMAKFSGVSFQEYAGFPWPEGQEQHRVAGVYYAQLVKQDDKSLLFRPGQRDCQIGDFTLEDARSEPAWRDEAGNGWCWEVREGDLRLFKQNAIRGSGLILQNATNIVILHRSKPYNNPKVFDEHLGRERLMDTRARLILDKTRNGSAMVYVPMGFDLQAPNGGAQRAQYFDVLAEEAVARGDFTPHSAFARPGDPILRPRPQSSPLVGHAY